MPDISVVSSENSVVVYLSMQLLVRFQEHFTDTRQTTDVSNLPSITESC